MSNIWDSSDIDRFASQGEQRFTDDYACIVKRYSPAIVIGTANYTLPSDCLSIRRVTYRGWKLEPFTQRDLRNTLMSGTQPGRPRYYNYSNITRNTIQLFPVPIEALASLSDSDLLGPGLLNGVAVEYYAISSATSPLPSYMRRRFLKAFVLWRCYLMEGKGNNIKAAAYYSSKWEFMKNMYEEKFNDLINAPRSLTTDPYVKDLPIPPFARLPINKFGISVEDEY